MSKKRNKRASVSLETAIVFGLVLILCCVVITALSVYRTDIIMQRAVDQSCEEFSVLTPLSIIGSDAVSVVTNSMPDEITSEVCTETLSNVLTYIGGVDAYTEGGVVNLILDGTLSEIMENDILSEFEERQDSSLIFTPEAIDVDFNVNYEDYVIGVSVSYEINTIVGIRQRAIYSVIPIYGDIDLFLNSSSNQAEQSNIWDSNNFERGDYFRERYGANVPKSFPVVDIWDGVEATTIVSIDTTAPTYQNYERLYARITEQVDDMSNFNGGVIYSFGESYTINGNDVHMRRVLVIIPSNTPNDVNECLENAVNYGVNSGIKVDIVTDLPSNRYIINNNN